ncbi:SUKH-4 family immunity protein [Streptomyces sp. NPDC002690]
MSGLTFDLTHDELVSWFGVANVERSVRAEAEELGFGGKTLGFLCDVGIPSTPRAEVAAPGIEVALRAIDEIPDSHWDVPQEARSWIVIGNLTATTIALDTVSGVVYGFYEGAGAPVALHADVSSLACTIHAVKRALPGIAERDSYDGREEIMRRVRQDIERRDPLPFSEGSEWLPSFEEIAMGMWS